MLFNLTMLCTYLFLMPIQQDIYFVERSIPLPASASTLSVNDLQQLYIVNNDDNEILKLSPDGKILKSIGGYGWSEGLFDDARSICATQLEVYIADYGNHRIQKFDKDLNFIAQFSSSGRDLGTFKFEYPISIDLSTLGDLYILDSKNKNVIKLNGFSKVERIFGGFEAGDLFLNNPTKIRVAVNQRVYILDESNLKVFDQFGNPLKIIPLNGLRIIDLAFQGEHLFLISKEKLFQLRSDGFKEILVAEGFETPIKGIKIKSELIYLLFDGEIKILRRGS
ncbi:MAG: NHL repeat-containing protein [Bacteroidetes bacterium]|nr:NHL repeat-containing protein [Bacteroidota bacterium]MBU2585197.1 NHL repeat-containing protein [Bacteroidota bacterium]